MAWIDGALASFPKTLNKDPGIFVNYGIETHFEITTLTPAVKAVTQH